MDRQDRRSPFELHGLDARPAGYAALVQRYGLEVLPHWRWTFVGQSHVRRQLERAGVHHEILPPPRWPGDRDIEHLLFALRYDGVSTSICRALFNADLDAWRAGITEAVKATPTGAYARRAWYLFEALTTKTLPVADLNTANYVPLLNPKRYVVGPAARSGRQRIRVNKIGTLGLSPTVRSTEQVKAIDGWALRDRVRAALDRYDPDIVRRALSYLYTRETLASFEIERERPPRNRAERFVAALKNAPSIEALNAETLTGLQQAIVEPRFEDRQWRRKTVYVGEAIDLARQRIHYVAPKANDVPELMDEFFTMTKALMDDDAIDPVVAAAVVSFTFVLIHPFTDGHGRIHRWLIHWVLSRKGVTPREVTVPVSAIMLMRRRDYDSALETFSVPLMERVRYELDADGHMTVKGDTIDLYRHPDLTRMTVALHGWLRAAVDEEMARELDFLVRFDRAREAVRSVLDMPDRLIDLFIQACRQNEGHLSRRKRDSHFAMLGDDEVRVLEEAVAEVFGAGAKGEV